MRRRVLFSPFAHDDLDQLQAWIAEDKPRVAAAYVQSVLERCQGLADFPRAGRKRHPDEELYVLPFRTVTLLYLLAEDVIILRVLSAGRDVEAALRERDW